MSKDNYLGQEGVKPAGIEIEFTPEQIEEYIRCSQDIDYFSRHYIKVIHVDRGEVFFEPYKYQTKMIQTCQASRFTIIKLPRQSGKSTTIVTLILHYILFTENWKATIFANKEKTARELLSRLQYAYKKLPFWLQQGVVVWNKGDIELENGSKVFAESTSKAGNRSASMNLLYLDEFAHVDNAIQEEFYTSVFPTVTSGLTTKVIITSTPNGMNLFYKLWSDSKRKKNSFENIEINWYETPGRDEKWKEAILKSFGKRAWSQEYECEFLGSSLTLIDGSTLRQLVPEDPINPPNYQDGNLNVYKNPILGHVYVMTVDTATGIQGDRSAFTVVDASVAPYEVVAVYKNDSIPVTMFPTVIYRIAKRYNDAYILAETNANLGSQVLEILHGEYEYDNLIMTRGGKNKQRVISTGFGTDSQELGLCTTKTTKAIGCSNLKTIVEAHQLLVNDFDIIYELARFAQKNNSYEAEDGFDDLAMCLVLFAWIANQPFIKEINNIDFRKRLLAERAEIVEGDLTPFGIYDFNQNDYNQEAVVSVVSDFENFLLDRDTNPTVVTDDDENVMPIL